MIKKVTILFEIMNNIDLVILAGGKGTRIKGLLKSKPKPMAKFNGKYFIEYIIQNFSKYDFRNIYILTGYKSNIIFNKFHNTNNNFIKIICLKEKSPMGTAGALYALKKRKVKDFLLINGDTIFDINLLSLIDAAKKNSIGSIALVENIKKNGKLSNLSIKNGTIIKKKKLWFDEWRNLFF